MLGACSQPRDVARQNELPIGVSLEVLDHDASKMRGARPFALTNLKSGKGLDRVIGFVETHGLLH